MVIDTVFEKNTLVLHLGGFRRPRAAQKASPSSKPASMRCVFPILRLKGRAA
jgi:hypothetical protein